MAVVAGYARPGGEPTTPVASVDSGPRVPSAAVADSIAGALALKREAAQGKVQRLRDSLVESRMAEAERQRRDSVELADAAAVRLAEQRARDSVAAADKRRRDSIDAQERVEAQARAAAQAETTRVTQERLRDTRLASGRTALNGWLQRLVAAVSCRRVACGGADGRAIELCRVRGEEQPEDLGREHDVARGG